MHTTSNIDSRESLSLFQQYCLPYFVSYFVLATKIYRLQDISLPAFVDFIKKYDEVAIKQRLHDSLETSLEITHAMALVREIALPAYTPQIVSLLDDTIFGIICSHAQSKTN